MTMGCPRRKAVEAPNAPSATWATRPADGQDCPSGRSRAPVEVAGRRVARGTDRLQHRLQARTGAPDPSPSHLAISNRRLTHGRSRHGPLPESDRLGAVRPGSSSPVLGAADVPQCVSCGRRWVGSIRQQHTGDQGA